MSKFKINDKVIINPNKNRIRWIKIGYVDEIRTGNPFLPDWLNWLVSTTYLIRSEDGLEYGYYQEKELKHECK